MKVRNYLTGEIREVTGTSKETRQFEGFTAEVTIWILDDGRHLSLGQFMDWRDWDESANVTPKS
jgi:hypothetical protein